MVYKQNTFAFAFLLGTCCSWGKAAVQTKPIPHSQCEFCLQPVSASLWETQEQMPIWLIPSGVQDKPLSGAEASQQPLWLCCVFWSTLLDVAKPCQGWALLGRETCSSLGFMILTQTHQAKAPVKEPELCLQGTASAICICFLLLPPFPPFSFQFPYLVIISFSLVPLSHPSLLYSHPVSQWQK